MMLSKNLLPQEGLESFINCRLDDLLASWQESAVAKSVREQTFPLHFLLRGLHVRLEDGDATVEDAGWHGFTGEKP